MTGTRVMIVDDSPFSRTVLANELQDYGCEVVGEADGIDALLDEYHRCKPDVVTMDIAMPGADGFECSRALLLHDPLAKIILVSSMKDEELEQEARKVGIAGYVQKPADPEILQNVIKNVLSPDDLFHELEDTGLETFSEALGQSITRMTKTVATFSEISQADTQVQSRGVTVVIGIIGRYSGRMMLDLPLEGAEQMVQSMLRREPKNRDEVLHMAAEFANVVAGVATSMLNKKNKAFAMRVAPPSVFYGAPAEITSPNMNVRGVVAETEFGRLYLDLGFKKGSVLWM